MKLFLFFTYVCWRKEKAQRTQGFKTPIWKNLIDMCVLFSLPFFFLMKKSRIWAWPKAPTWAPSWTQIWLEMKKKFEFEFRFLLKTLALDFVAHWTTFDLENNSARVVATQARIIFLFFFFYNSIIELLSTLKVVWS
jgi:hypothetical protein